MTPLFQKDLVESLIIKDAKHLEQKLREAIQARVGDVPMEELRGRLPRRSTPFEDCYYLDNELLLIYKHKDFDEDILWY